MQETKKVEAPCFRPVEGKSRFRLLSLDSEIIQPQTQTPNPSSEDRKMEETAVKNRKETSESFQLGEEEESLGAGELIVASVRTHRARSPPKVSENPERLRSKAVKTRAFWLGDRSIHSNTFRILKSSTRSDSPCFEVVDLSRKVLLPHLQDPQKERSRTLQEKVDA